MSGFGLRYPLVRFIVVGCANFVVSLAAFYGSYQYLSLGESSGRGAVANVLAYAAGMISSFVLNRLWTFRVEGHIVAHAFKFVVLNAVTLVASTVVVLVLVDWVGYSALAVWLPLTIAVLTAHYLGMKYWAFAEPR